MRPAEHVRASVTNDGLVVLDIDKGEIFSANVIAARIWQGLVVDGKERQVVVDSIVSEWGAPAESVERDLDAFVETLVARHLVSDARD